MKLIGKAVTIIAGILLLGSSLNVVAANRVLIFFAANRHRRIKRKHPVINDRRKAIVSQKFSCNGKQYVVNYITNNSIQLVDAVSNAKFQLDQVVSGSGSRYSNGKIEIHIKGDEAVFNQDGKDISCNLTK